MILSCCRSMVAVAESLGGHGMVFCLLVVELTKFNTDGNTKRAAGGINRREDTSTTYTVIQYFMMPCECSSTSRSLGMNCSAASRLSYVIVTLASSRPHKILYDCIRDMFLIAPRLRLARQRRLGRQENEKQALRRRFKNGIGVVL